MILKDAQGQFRILTEPPLKKIADIYLSDTDEDFYAHFNPQNHFEKLQDMYYNLCQNISQYNNTSTGDLESILYNIENLSEFFEKKILRISKNVSTDSGFNYALMQKWYNTLNDKHFDLLIKKVEFSLYHQEDFLLQ